MRANRAMSDGPGPGNRTPQAGRGGQQPAPGMEAWKDPGNVREAVLALMDSPHPLEILAEAKSYGNDGSISRYHNPDNYKRALGTVYAAKRNAFRERFHARGESVPDWMKDNAREGSLVGPVTLTAPSSSSSPVRQKASSSEGDQPPRVGGKGAGRRSVRLRRTAAHPAHP